MASGWFTANAFNRSRLMFPYDLRLSFPTIAIAYTRLELAIKELGRRSDIHIGGYLCLFAGVDA